MNQTFAAHALRKFLAQNRTLAALARAIRLRLYKSVNKYWPHLMAPSALLATHYAFTENNPKLALNIIDRALLDRSDFDMDDKRLIDFVMIYHLAGRYEDGRQLLKRIADAREARAPNDSSRSDLRLFSTDLLAFVGHLALLDTFYKADILGIIPHQQGVIFGDPKSIANPSYLRYWDGLYSLVTDTAAVARLQSLERNSGLEYFNIACTDGKNRDLAIFGSSFAREVQLRWEAERGGHLLNLSAEHKDRGYRLLRELGMPEGAWFVGLHVRESTDAMREVRNANLASYRMAVEEIARRGGWVLRVGNNRMAQIEDWPNTIDFAHNPHRSDWMDVFIWAEGRFLIGMGSGPQMVPVTFGKPVVITNWGPLGMLIASRDDILLPKHYWHEKDARFLTMQERMGHRYGIQESARALADADITVVDNTPEEIRNAVIDMIEQVERRLVYSGRERELQSRFAAAAAANGVYPVRLSKEFLATRPELLAASELADNASGPKFD